MILNLVITICLILLNGFFVAAEFAIIKIRQSQIDMKINEWNSTAKRTKHILERLDKYLSATQLWITSAWLWLWYFGSQTFESFASVITQPLWLIISQETITIISTVLAFILLTMTQILFGELLPKALSITSPLKSALFITRPLKIFYTVFKPFIRTLNQAFRVVSILFWLKNINENESHTEEEIKLILTDSEESWIIKSGSNELIHNVFDFDDRIVKQILTPRSQVCALEINQPINEILTTVIDQWYSRIPVYEWSVDSIIWILHTKDLFAMCLWKEIKDISSLLRPVHTVSPMQKVETLLKDFQTMHIQLAVVTNEFWEFAGIVTMEDIIEELVWDIQDEHDEEKPLFIEKKPGEFLISWMMSISNCEELLQINLPDDDSYETVAWFVQSLHERIPHVWTTITYADFSITVTKKVKHRIDELLVKKIVA